MSRPPAEFLTIHEPLSYEYIFDRQCAALDPNDENKIFILGCREGDYKLNGRIQTLMKKTHDSKKQDDHNNTQIAKLNVKDHHFHFLIYDTQNKSFEDLSNAANISQTFHCYFATMISTKRKIHVIAQWEYPGPHFLYGRYLNKYSNRYYCFQSDNENQNIKKISTIASGESQPPRNMTSKPNIKDKGKYSINSDIIENIHDIRFNHDNYQYSEIDTGMDYVSLIFEDWMFVSGGCKHDEVFNIFRLIDNAYDEHSSKDASHTIARLVKTVTLSTFYCKHGMIVKSYSKDTREIEILLFGSSHCPFATSLNIVRLQLPVDIIDKKTEFYCQPQCKMIDQVKVWSVFDIDTIRSITDFGRFNRVLDTYTTNVNSTSILKTKSYKINDDLSKNQISILRTIFGGSERGDCLCAFSYHYLQQRYLIIIGGKRKGFEDYPVSMKKLKIESYLSTILCFDFQDKKWYISKYSLPMKIFDHSSVLSNDKRKIYIFGSAYDENKDVKMNIHWVLNVEGILSWKIARLIWIAFYKNDKNDKCFIDKLPKDIVNKILNEFLSSQSLIDSMMPILEHI